MINSFLNVNISKKIFTAINPITDTKYTFIKHNKGEDVTQNLQKYGQMLNQNLKMNQLRHSMRTHWIDQ